MLFVSDQMPFLYKIEADWKCTKEDLIDSLCFYVFQLLHLKPWKAPDMEKATDVADISCTQIHPVPWPDIMSVTWKKRQIWQIYLPFESMLCKYLNIIMYSLTFFFGFSMSATLYPAYVFLDST